MQRGVLNCLERLNNLREISTVCLLVSQSECKGVSAVFWKGLNALFISFPLFFETWIVC